MKPDRNTYFSQLDVAYTIKQMLWAEFVDAEEHQLPGLSTAIVIVEGIIATQKELGHTGSDPSTSIHPTNNPNKRNPTMKITSENHANSLPMGSTVLAEDNEAFIKTSVNGWNGYQQARTNRQLVGGKVLHSKSYKVGDVLPISEARTRLPVGAVIERAERPAGGAIWKRFELGWFATNIRCSPADDRSIHEVNDTMPVRIISFQLLREEE